MRLFGILSCLAYRLSRHRFVRLPLDLLIASGTLAAVLYALVQAVRSGQWPWAPALLIPLALCGVLLLVMRLSSFVLFRLTAQPTLVRSTLEPFEKVAVRASGVFEVGEERCYYVEARGSLQATELGERVLMVQVRPLSLLGFLRSREEEWGWWYIFFRPDELGAPVCGRLCFGWSPRPALRLSYRGQDRPLAYLSFEDPRTRDRVAADLQAAGAGGAADASFS